MKIIVELANGNRHEVQEADEGVLRRGFIEFREPGANYAVCLHKGEENGIRLFVEQGQPEPPRQKRSRPHAPIRGETRNRSRFSPPMAPAGVTTGPSESHSRRSAGDPLIHTRSASSGPPPPGIRRAAVGCRTSLADQRS
jgi:hypothetical protein